MFKGPDQNLLQVRVVEKRWYIRQVNSMRNGHRIFYCLKLRLLKWPWNMVYIPSIDPFSRYDCIEAVTFSEPVF